MMSAPRDVVSSVFVESNRKRGFDKVVNSGNKTGLILTLNMLYLKQFQPLKICIIGLFSVILREGTDKLNLILSPLKSDVMFELLLTIFLIPVFTIAILLFKFAFWLLGQLLRLTVWLVKAAFRWLGIAVTWLWRKAVMRYNARPQQTIP